MLRDTGNLLIYLHRVSVAARPANAVPLQTSDLIQALSQAFDIIDHANQGGLGSHIRVEFSIWLGEFIIRRPLARWTLQIIFLPLSPVLVVFGGLAVMLTFLLDLLDWSGRFFVSSLVLARKRP